MIEIRNGFQDLLFRQEFLKIQPEGYELYLKIHKYDKQKLKSLLKEMVELNNYDIEWVKEEQMK